MARVVKSRWFSVVLVVLCAIGIGWMISGYFSRPKAAAQVAQSPSTSSAPTIDVDTFQQVQSLRGQLCLTTPDLAAIGCSQTDAQGVLTALMTWNAANKGSLDQAQQVELTARQQVQEAMRQINVGPKNASLLAQLPTLNQQVADATRQKQQVLAGAVSVVQAQLNATEQSLWNTALSNASFPEQYRYAPGLTAAQAQSLQVALYKSYANPAGAQAVVYSIITPSQSATLEQVQQNRNSLMMQVAQAEQAVLPLPAALKPVQPVRIAPPANP